MEHTDCPLEEIHMVCQILDELGLSKMSSDLIQTKSTNDLHSYVKVIEIKLRSQGDKIGALDRLYFAGLIH